MAGRNIINGFSKTDYQYKNFVKNLTDWQISGTAYPSFPSLLNSDNYPTTAPPAGRTLQALVYIPSSANGLNLVIKWSGSAGLIFNHATTEVGSSGFVIGSTASTMTVRGAAARAVFKISGTWTGGSINIQIQSSETVSNWANFVICLATDESAIDGGIATEQFNVDFISALTTLNPAGIRGVDWSGINQQSMGHNATRAEYITQPTNLSYNQRRWLPNVWVGAITNTADALTSSAPADAAAGWTDGETWQGVVSATNAGTTPTITFGGRTAKTIVRANGNALLVGGSGILATGPVTFIYNATLDKVIYCEDGLAPGVPVLVHAALCNKLNVGMYYNIPHKLSDAAFTTVATLIRDNLTSGLPLIIALDNEDWNFVYAMTTLYANMGAALGFPLANNERIHGYAALRFRQMMGLLASVWNRGNLYRAIEVQAAGNVSQYKTYRFEGADLGAYGYSTVGSRPIDYCDAIAIAPYVNGAVTKDLDAHYSATDISGLTTAADGNDLSWLDTDVRSGTRGGVLGDSTLLSFSGTIFPAWNTACTTTGYPANLKMIMYENGFQCLAPTTAECTTLGISTSYSASIQTLITNYKNNYRATLLVHDHLKSFFSQSRALYGNWYTFGEKTQWSLNVSDLYSGTYKTWDGLVLDNAGKRRIVW